MNDDAVFLKDEADYDNYVALKPRYKFDRKKVSFVCKKCGDVCTRRFLGLTKDFLCGKCAISRGRSSDAAKDRYRQTCLEKYGVENPSRAETVKEKRRKTALKNFGVDNPAKAASVRERMRETCMERYGVCNYSKTDEYREKYKSTCMEKYGVENPSQSDIIKQKKIETCNENHGCDFPMQSEEILRKACDTNIARYNARRPLQNKEIYEKAAKTNLDRYGSETPLACPKIISSVKQKHMDNFGTEYPLQSKEIRDRIGQSVFKKYSVENPMQVKEIREKAADTHMMRYNVKYPMQCDITKAKAKCSMIERYGQMGVSYSFHYDNRRFDSSWEVAYYIWLKDNGMDFEYKPKVKFDYEYCGKVHSYFPDFRVGTEYHEIKGLQFFENGKATGKMVNLYDHSLDELFETKHQCMMQNDIKIIVDCGDYLKYVETTYGENYIFKFSKMNIDEIYRGLPREFPYYDFDTAALRADYETLTSNINRHSGLKMIKHYYRNIYESHVGRYKSPAEAWGDESLMRRLIANRLQYKGVITPEILRQGLSVAKIAPRVSIFRPYTAFGLIRKYLGDYGTIFDPFSGFGGRMLGAVAAGKKYIGQDINGDTVGASNEIIKKYGLDAQVTCRDVFESAGTYECLFTCSPYGLKEVWNENESDLSCDQWIDECLSRFACKRYLFVVDKTEKYKDKIVETIENRSHFGANKEYVIMF